MNTHITYKNAVQTGAQHALRIWRYRYRLAWYSITPNILFVFIPPVFVLQNENGKHKPCFCCNSTFLKMRNAWLQGIVIYHKPLFCAEVCQHDLCFLLILKFALSQIIGEISTSALEFVSKWKQNKCMNTSYNACDCLLFLCGYFAGGVGGAEGEQGWYEFASVCVCLCWQG